MQIGMIGLGQIGLGTVRRLLRSGRLVAAYDRTLAKAQEFSPIALAPPPAL